MEDSCRILQALIHLIDEYPWHELGTGRGRGDVSHMIVVVLIVVHQLTSQAHLTAWCQERGENDAPRCYSSITAGRSWDTLWLLYSHLTCKLGRSHSFPLQTKARCLWVLVGLFYSVKEAIVNSLTQILPSFCLPLWHPSSSSRPLWDRAAAQESSPSWLEEPILAHTFSCMP